MVWSLPASPEAVGEELVSERGTSILFWPRLQGEAPGGSLGSRVPGETRDILEFTLQQGLHAGWILWGRTIVVTGLAGGFPSYFQACSVEPERLQARK